MFAIVPILTDFDFTEMEDQLEECHELSEDDLDILSMEDMEYDDAPELDWVNSFT